MARSGAAMPSTCVGIGYSSPLHVFCPVSLHFKQTFCILISYPRTCHAHYSRPEAWRAFGLGIFSGSKSIFSLAGFQMARLARAVTRYTKLVTFELVSFPCCGLSPALCFQSMRVICTKKASSGF
jgi:hypothetical protein